MKCNACYECVLMLFLAEPPNPGVFVLILILRISYYESSLCFFLNFPSLGSIIKYISLKRTFPELATRLTSELLRGPLVLCLFFLRILFNVSKGRGKFGFGHYQNAKCNWGRTEWWVQWSLCDLARRWLLDVHGMNSFISKWGWKPDWRAMIKHI